MSNEKKKSICKLNLDIGIYVENVDELSKREEDLWMKVYHKFNYMSPLGMIKVKEKNTYVCKLYPDKCPECPAYQQ